MENEVVDAITEWGGAPEMVFDPEGRESQGIKLDGAGLAPEDGKPPDVLEAFKGQERVVLRDIAVVVPEERSVDGSWASGAGALPDTVSIGAAASLTGKSVDWLCGLDGWDIYEFLVMESAL
jgi:hypothetical protein